MSGRTEVKANKQKTLGLSRYLRGSKTGDLFWDTEDAQSLNKPTNSDGERI